MALGKLVRSKLTSRQLLPIGPVAKFSGSAEPLTAPAPRLGEHNAEVLAELLGYTSEQIGRFERDGVISMAKETSQ